MDNQPVRSSFRNYESDAPFGNDLLPVSRAGDGIEPSDDDRVFIDHSGF